MTETKFTPGPWGWRTEVCERGLTKREYFAALAMQGLLAGGYCIDDPINRTTDPVSEAVVLADNLIAELDKEAT